MTTNNLNETDQKLITVIEKVLADDVPDVVTLVKIAEIFEVKAKMSRSILSLQESMNTRND